MQNCIHEIILATKTNKQTNENKLHEHNRLILLRFYLILYSFCSPSLAPGDNKHEQLFPLKNSVLIPL